VLREEEGGGIAPKSVNSWKRVLFQERIEAWWEIFWCLPMHRVGWDHLGSDRGASESDPFDRPAAWYTWVVSRRIKVLLKESIALQKKNEPDQEDCKTEATRVTA